MKSMGSGLYSGSRPTTIANSVTPSAQIYVAALRRAYVGRVGVVGLVGAALGRVEVRRAGRVGHESGRRASQHVQRAIGHREIGPCELRGEN